jgi:hypothetical protein
VIERAVVLLERVVPLARAISTAVLSYTVAIAVAGATIAAVVAWLLAPTDLWAWMVLLVVVALLVLPSVTLALFYLTLREVLALPDKVRRLPEVAPDRAAELSLLVAEAREREGGVRFRTLPGDSLQVGRLLLKLRDDLPWAGALLGIMRVPFLMAVVVAFVAGLVELMLAPVFVAAALVVLLL